jgi:nucleotide-binding universal stress UspA family protein
MWDRMLLALDQYESGQSALKMTTQLATTIQSEVRVLHIRELSKWVRVPPIESPGEADFLVGQAVFALRVAGVGAEGRSCSVFEDHVAQRIVEESLSWLCDVIVLGTRRLRGLGRLSGHGVRDHVLRLSPLPVIAAPTPWTNARHRPPRTGLAGIDPGDTSHFPSDNAQ